MFSNNPLPFAIIAEEENEYTSLFDEVILTDESMHSFTDKFLLLKLCPYDENIFFDADSLAYGDLNEYWDFFSNSTDFSAIGKNYSIDDRKGAWYYIEDIGEYGKQITYKTRVHAGVCFIRKSDKLVKMYFDCMDLYHNYDKLRFHSYANSIDECIFGIAMPMNQMKAVPEKQHMIAAYPCLKQVKADILRCKLSYSTEWAGYTPKGILLHWGTAQTYKPLYRFNAECLKYLYKYPNKCAPFIERMRYEYKLRYITLYFEYLISSVYRLGVRFIKKLNKN